MDIKKLENKINSLRKLADVDNKVTIPGTIKLDPNDMECLIRVFKTLDYKDDFATQVKASSHRELIGKWLSILNNLTYSNIVCYKQYLHPRYNIATSIPMLAAKESQNISYNSWKEESLSRLFHPNMAVALASAPKDYSRIKFSEEILNAAKPRGDLQSYTIKYVGTRYEGEDEDGPVTLWEGFDQWPIIIKHMKLQTWIFHPQFRGDTMILDPNDWDYMPPDLHGGNTVSIPGNKPPTPPKKPIDDLMI